MPKRQRSGSASLTRDMQRAAGRRTPSRRSLRGAGKIWINAYTESDGTRISGHWRAEPGVSTLKKDDLQQHVGRQLGEHAAALSRAEAIKAQLQAYAQALAGRA